MTTWGIATTAKAEVQDILTFAAHHLEQGADHITIYLDAPNKPAREMLNAHPNCTAIRTNQDYWATRKGGRPKKHQVRQSWNATQAYHTSRLDWLAHIDVDEFLMPTRPIYQFLSEANPQDRCILVRPSEALVPLGGRSHDAEILAKAYMPRAGDRLERSAPLYPEFHRHLRGGFMSHDLGKVFVRTGQPEIKISIHRAKRDDGSTLPVEETIDCELLHRHVASWESWMNSFRYRHRKGSYRQELAAATSPDFGSLNLHEVFEILEGNEGPTGLRRFFDEVCVARPELLSGLQSEGLLRRYELDAPALIAKHFPQFDGNM